MTTVNIHEAKTKLSSLLSLVETKKERITICRAGKPIAEIIPCKQVKRSSVKAANRPLKVSGDLTLPSSQDWNA
ncbi:MAG: type II toxin-antitoxin system prevent-host-death family antitoxin [Proteobacteria bacterium]|nr:type II toxin-antitoxin system prevent-host-death family antitoxin [Pseudomonadota bacterium]